MHILCISYLLHILVEREHFTMALALAEKYQDYALMIAICDKEQNMEKLENYKITLADKVQFI